MSERQDRWLWWALAGAWLFCGAAIMLRLLSLQGRCRWVGPWLPCEAPSDSALTATLAATLGLPLGIAAWRAARRFSRR